MHAGRHTTAAVFRRRPCFLLTLRAGAALADRAQDLMESPTLSTQVGSVPTSPAALLHGYRSTSNRGRCCAQQQLRHAVGVHPLYGHSNVQSSPLCIASERQPAAPGGLAARPLRDSARLHSPQATPASPPHLFFFTVANPRLRFRSGTLWRRLVEALLARRLRPRS
jgi:hypothetical protein